MKKEYTLSQQFAIVGLDGLSTDHHSAVKSAAVRGISAAVLLEEILLRKDVLDTLPSKNTEDVAEFQRELESGLTAVKKMNGKKMDLVEKKIADLLFVDGGIEIVPDLLGCDMNYYTASVTLRSYRSRRDIYLSVVESVRAEILEDGPVTLECVCLLWLMRESGCLHDIFSVREQEQIEVRMTTVCAQNVLENILWRQEFHHGVEQMVKSFLSGKRKLFKNPYLEGVNLQFPFLDRRQAIFVDFVVFGTNVKERRQAMKDFLEKNGHHVETMKSGTETLLLIDNAYYRVFPKTVSGGKIPIQGASLLPVYR